MNFLRQTTLRTKASIALSIAMIFIVTMGLLGLIALHQVNNATKEIRGFWVPKIESLDDLKRAAGATAGLATGRIQATSFRQIADIDKRLTGTQERLVAAGQALKPMLRSAIEQDLATQFWTHWTDFESELRAALVGMEAGATAASQARFNTVALGAVSQAEKSLDELLEFSKQRMNRGVERAEQVYSLAIVLTILAILIGVCFSVAVILWTSRQVTSPIISVSAAMRRLTAGDHSVTLISRPDRKDEIGTLIEAVAGYRESLILSKRLTDDVAAERERLHAALTNMPQGLVMFDATNRIVVCNARYVDMYDLPRDIVKPGCTLRELLTQLVAAGHVTAEVDDYHSAVLAEVSHDRSIKMQKTVDGRDILITKMRMLGGGWVATHDDITERQAAQAKISHMALHDALTGLPNRLYFSEQLEHRFVHRDRDEKFAVLCFDLDRFKSVNDTLGHSFGDNLLCQVGERIRACLREGDALARLGGDEFAVLHSSVKNLTEINALASRLIEVIARPFDLDGHQAVIGVSIGIAVAPADAAKPDQLLKNADMALYRAKADGRGTYRFFEPEMDARMQKRRTLELDLRKALLNSEFELYYQPIVKLDSDEICGFEALLRWNHPERGLVPPLEFISLAEETELIIPIGEWVLRQACTEAATWPGSLGVAVNISSVQFKMRNLLQMVISALASSGLPAQQLELEITESVLLFNNELTLKTLHQLRNLGVRISMDDFGTGYSSLSYLRSFPFDKIKIDRSFIHDVTLTQDSMAIIRAVTGLGTSLGMTTTGEGVETLEELEYLRKEGCTEAQGYFYSQPKPASEIHNMLSKQRRPSKAVA